MKKKKALFPLIVFLLFFIYQCGDDSPTEPEKPKKRASIEINIENEPIQWNYYTWSDTWNANYTVIISEHNGVGGQVTTVKTEMFEGETMCASNTESGGRFSPNGTKSVWCSVSVPGRYTFDKQVITVEGRDDNGFSFSESITYTWTWSNSRLTSK